MNRWILLVLISTVIGCTVEEADTTANNAPNNEQQTTSSNSSTNTTTNSTTPSATSFELEITRVEWGVLPNDVDTTPSRPITAGSLSESHNFELGAGVSRIVFIVDGERFQFSSDRLVAAPIGPHSLVPDTGEGGLVFAPDQIGLEVSFESATSIEILPSPSGRDAPAFDELGHADDINNAMFAFLNSYDPSGADRSAVFQLLERVREQGGTPVQTSSGALFLAPSVPGDDPDIRGSFNSWERTSGYELRQLVPGLSIRFVPMESDRHAYKIAYGESWTTDRANRHIEWDGFVPPFEQTGDFNSVWNPTDDASRLVLWPGVESVDLDNERDIYVYLPPAYDEGAEHPLLIAHDGNESITRGQFHEALDAWAAGKSAEKQPVVAFVGLEALNQRMGEYTFASEGARGSLYAAFLVDHIVPSLRGAVRVSSDRRATGLVGASLGGLISYYVLSQHSDLFGYAAGMSSSFFWADNAMLDVIRQNGCFNADFYLDSGSPNDNFVVTQEMRDLLDAEGCRYRYVLDEGGTHEWWKWNERLPGVLDHFAEVVP